MKAFMIFSAFLGMTATAQAQQPSFSAQRFAVTIQQVDLSLQRAAKVNGFYRMNKLQQAEVLSRSGVRVAAFSLQSLGRLYENYPLKETQEYAKKIRENAKDLEDALGNFDKYKTVGKPAKAEEAAKEAIKLIEEKEWLNGSGASPRSYKMVMKLRELRWLNAEQDRKFLLYRLTEQMHGLNQTRYDMRLLEGGLHELRRELRWFVIYALSMEGLLIGSTTKACPQRQPIFTKYGDKKYTIPTSTQHPGACEISNCLAQEIVGAVGIFGNLKDAAEPLYEADDKLKEKDLTPPQIVPQAQRAYVTLMKSGILAQTEQQLKECLR